MRRLGLSLLLAWIGLSACVGDGPSDGASTQASATTGTTASTPSGAAGPPKCVPPGGESPRPGLDVVVSVFLFCDGGMMPVDLHPVSRVVPADGAPLRSALTQLLFGVTPAEASGGLQSAFEAHTAGTLRKVTVKAGVARLDFTRGFEATNNFSTTSLSGVVLRQIETTVLQFPEITGIEFAIEGERWCLWENTCDDAPFPLLTR